MVHMMGGTNPALLKALGFGTTAFWRMKTPSMLKCSETTAYCFVMPLIWPPKYSSSRNGPSSRRTTAGGRRTEFAPSTTGTESLTNTKSCSISLQREKIPHRYIPASAKLNLNWLTFRIFYGSAFHLSVSGVTSKVRSRARLLASFLADEIIYSQ